MNILLKIYKNTFSLLLTTLFGRGCRFTPTCSEYFTQAVLKHGTIKGSILGLKRISRCHPYTKPGYDPIPN